jgi:Helix-turn-helix of DDE superfamily endonuclease
MLFYPAALPLSRQTLDNTAGIIRRHRRQTGSPWRKLNPGRQALLVLAYLRKGETFAELAAGFGISTNRAHARLRAPGERANAQLKSWRILRKLRCCPWRAGQLAKAVHVLQTREIGG